MNICGINQEMKKIFILLFITLISCNTSLNKKAEAAMQQYDNFILHVDAKGIAGMFTADGELAGPGMSVHSRDSIEHFLNQFKDFKVEEQKNTTDSIRKIADTAFQYGKYYQRAVVNNTKAEVHGLFQANWVIQADGKLFLKKMSILPTGSK